MIYLAWLCGSKRVCVVLPILRPFRSIHHYPTPLYKKNSRKCSIGSYLSRFSADKKNIASPAATTVMRVEQSRCPQSGSAATPPWNLQSPLYLIPWLLADPSPTTVARGAAVSTWRRLWWRQVRWVEGRCVLLENDPREGSTDTRNHPQLLSVPSSVPIGGTLISLVISSSQ